MLFKRLIWLIRRHLYTPALIYFQKILHFLTFQASKLQKTEPKKRKNWHNFHALYGQQISSHIRIWINDCPNFFLWPIVCLFFDETLNWRCFPSPWPTSLDRIRRLSFLRTIFYFHPCVKCSEFPTLTFLFIQVFTQHGFPIYAFSSSNISTLSKSWIS